LTFGTTTSYSKNSSSGITLSASYENWGLSGQGSVDFNSKYYIYFDARLLMDEFGLLFSLLFNFICLFLFISFLARIKLDWANAVVNTSSTYYTADIRIGVSQLQLVCFSPFFFLNIKKST
jgi:hypothetical protein